MAEARASVGRLPARGPKPSPLQLQRPPPSTRRSILGISGRSASGADGAGWFFDGRLLGLTLSNGPVGKAGGRAGGGSGSFGGYWGPPHRGSADSGGIDRTGFGRLRAAFPRRRHWTQAGACCQGGHQHTGGPWARWTAGLPTCMGAEKGVVDFRESAGYAPHPLDRSWKAESIAIGLTAPVAHAEAVEAKCCCLLPLLVALRPSSADNAQSPWRQSPGDLPDPLSQRQALNLGLIAGPGCFAWV